MKLLVFLIDGLGDVTIPGYEKTPLQIAHTPWLNTLARKSFLERERKKKGGDHGNQCVIYIGTGVNGLLDPVEPGLACGSDTAHLSILGYDPRT